MESRRVYEPHLKAGPMLSCRWPTQIKHYHSFDYFFSHIALSWNLFTLESFAYVLWFKTLHIYVISLCAIN